VLAVWIPYWDLRCEKCSDGLKKLNGCEEDSYQPERWKIREWSWQRCPIKLITPETNAFIDAYNFLQKGILPYQRGYKLNPNRYVEAMGIIGGEVKRIEAEQIKQMKK
jgi:hypothetical protein